MKATSLSIPIVFTLLAAPALRAQCPPSRHRAHRNLKAKAARGFFFDVAAGDRPICAD